MSQQEATRRQLFDLLMQAPAMIALLRGPHHVYELANQLYLEAILQNAGDGMTVHDVEGSMLYVNDVAARMSGFPSAEAMLTASSEVYHQTLKRFVVKDESGHLLKPEDFPGRRALREGRGIQQLLHYHDNVTERSFWSYIKSQPIFNEEGRAQLVVNVLVDMSEQQELEQRKNEFISMASHELKTPVTSLKGFANVLQRRLARQGDEQGLHYLSRMEAQLDKLTGLISDCWTSRACSPANWRCVPRRSIWTDLSRRSWKMCKQLPRPIAYLSRGAPTRESLVIKSGWRRSTSTCSPMPSSTSDLFRYDQMKTCLGQQNRVLLLVKRYSSSNHLF